MELKDKIEELGTAFEAFKKANDARLSEIATKGAASSLTEEKVSKINEELSKLTQEVEQAKSAMNRTRQTETENDAEKKSEYGKAFEAWMRKGLSLEGHKTIQMSGKAMSVNSDEDGGFLVSPEMASEMVTFVYESSPIRQLASVQTISTDALEVMEDLDQAGFGWVGETQARDATDTPKFKKMVIPVHEMYAKPLVTQKLLDDAAINIESWLSQKVGERFGRGESTAFVSGDGVNKPRGFLTYAAGTAREQIEQVVSGSASTVTGDKTIDMFYALKEAYRKNSTWLMKRATVAEFRKLKDVTSGQYLWQPGLNGDQQPTLLGRPVMDADDMQAIGGANNLIVALGDFKAGYQIVDRIGVRILRDPYSNKPNVEFYITKRVGGAVKNFEAIKLMKQST